MVEIEDKLLKNYRHKQIIIWIICAAVILVSGVVIGVGGTIFLAKQGTIWIHPAHKDANEIAKEISEKYGLNPQQTSQLEAVFKNAFERRQLRQQESEKNRDEETQILINDMNSVLTPEQFQRWNNDFQIMREKFKNRFKDKK